MLSTFRIIHVRAYYIFFIIATIFCLHLLSSHCAGQILPYLPFTQSYTPFYSNPYIGAGILPYNRISQYTFLNPYNISNPYIGFYNPFSVLNSAFSQFAGSSLYPQASVAGGLVPFNSYLINPFVPPYFAAAAYFAAVTTADVSGSWSGTWLSTFLAAGAVAGDLSITLAQNGTEVTGTAAFLLNKVLKYGATVVGTVDGNLLTLTSTVVTSIAGTMVFDVTITATVTDLTMEGTYSVINLSTGLLAEEGTFIASRL